MSARIKYPKTFTAGGVRFGVRLVPGVEGAFDSVSKTIEIGRNLDNDQDRVWAWMHETFESAAALQGRRYESGCETGDYVFVMTHKEMDQIIRAVALGVLDLLRANGVPSD